MTTDSAGIAMWREGEGGGIEVLLVHPGGPFWQSKDEHAWSVPKGEFDPATEHSLDAARREFAEELGRSPPTAGFVDLGAIPAGRKRIHLWACRGDLDIDAIESNRFEIEWPPKSGRWQEFPEVDRAEWVALDEARTKLHKGQSGVIDALAAHLDGGPQA